MSSPSLTRLVRIGLATLVVVVGAATLSVDRSWTLWSAHARWVWSGYQSAQISTSELGLAAITLLGWLTKRTVPRPMLESAPGRRVTLVAGHGLVSFVGLSAIGAAAPYLSLGRLAAVSIGVLACLAIARESPLRDWLFIAGLAVVLIQLPLVIGQQVSQSTYPLATLSQSGAAEIPATAPGAFVLQLVGGLRWQRSLGSFPHPNVLGGFAATMIVLGLPRLRAGGEIRWAVLIVWILAWIELGLSFSRAGALAAAIGCAVWGFPRVRKVNVARAALPVGFAIAGLVVAEFGSRLLAGDTSQLASGPAVSERLLLASVAGTMIWQHPFLGVGAGNFPLVESLPPFDGVMVDPVHVVPLLVAAEAGIVAGIAWLVLVIGPPIAELWAGRGNGTGVFDRAAAAATILTLGCLDHYFWTLPPGRSVFWIALGVGVAP